MEIPKNIIELVEKCPNYVRDFSDFYCDKIIGKGSFGEVWHAHDNKTQKECAVKQLYATDLNGKNEKVFIREIYTNAVCRDRFIVELVGFTIEPPYCIITAFQTGGCLLNYVFEGTPHYGTLSPTHMTLISMCLAHACMKIQENGIVHRDIKPANILLNEKKLPILCDFGIARECVSDGTMSRKTGTLIYMAPELFSTRDYGTKVDVYAFGMLLYEMAEGRHAYDDITKDRMESVLEGGIERPKFYKSGPILQSVIIRCWDQNPSKRPNFRVLYEEFAGGRIGFDKFDKKKMIDMGIKIIEYEKKQLPPPEILVNIKNVVQKLKTPNKSEKNEEESIYKSSGEKTQVLSQKPPLKSSMSTGNLSSDKENVKTNYIEELKNNISILSDSNHPKFFSFLSEISQCLSPDLVEGFYNNSLLILSSNQNVPAILAVLRAFYTGLRENHKFIEYCLTQGFFFKLPVGNRQFIGLDISLYAEVFIYTPYLVNESFVQWVNYFFSVEPDDMMCALAHYIKKNPELEKGAAFFDILISNGSRFLGIPSGRYYVSILLYIISKYPQYASHRMENIRGLLSAFSQSQRIESCYAAYSALGHIWDPQYSLNFEYILQLSSVQAMHLPLHSLLFKMYNQIPVSKITCEIVLSLSRQHPQSNILPLIFSQVSVDGAKLLAESSTWMKAPIPTVMDNFRLLVLLFSIPEAKEAIVQNESFPYLITLLCSSMDPYIIGSLGIIIGKSQINAKFITDLTNAGFFRYLVSSFPNLRNINILNSAITLIDLLARAGYSSDYPHLIKILMELLYHNQEITVSVLSSIASLSFHSECTNIMKNMGLLEYFSQLKSHPNYHQYANCIITNLSK